MDFSYLGYEFLSFHKVIPMRVSIGNLTKSVLFV